MGVTINGDGTITSTDGTVDFGDDNLATTGTIPAAQLTGTMPAVSGAAITALNASNLASGTVATARLGTGTASSSTFLRGDGSWAEAGGGAWSVKTSGTFSSTATLDIAVTKTTSVWLTDVRLSSDAGHQFRNRFSTDGGSSFITTSTYDQRNGTTYAANQDSFLCGGGSYGAEADEGICGWFTVFDPNNSSVMTQAKWSFVGVDTGGTVQNIVGGGHQHAAAAVNAIRIQSTSGAFTSGKFIVLELN